jgi:hypothetical protein
MIRQIAIMALSATSIAAAFAAQPARALCLTSQAGNDCVTFNPSSSSSVLQTYTSLNLPTNTDFQLGFRSSNGVSYAISNIRYSLDNSTFTTLGTGSSTTTATFNYGSIISGTAGSMSNPFYIAYDLPAGIPDGVVIDSSFLANAGGAQSGGVLSSTSGNGFLTIERPSTATAISVPGPLPILGAAAAFSQARRLRSKTRLRK